MNRVGVYKTGDNFFLVAVMVVQAKYNVPAVAENVVSFRDTLRADQDCFWFGEILHRVSHLVSALLFQTYRALLATARSSSTTSISICPRAPVTTG